MPEGVVIESCGCKMGHLVVARTLTEALAKAIERDKQENAYNETDELLSRLRKGTARMEDLIALLAERRADDDIEEDSFVADVTQFHTHKTDSE